MDPTLQLIVDSSASVFDSAKKWNWVSIVSMCAALWAAHTAKRALTTWKHQARAQLATKFLDDLTDSVHEFITAIGHPVHILEFVQIGIQSYSDTASLRDNKAKYAGIVSYIVKNGKEDQERLRETLNKIGPIKSRMMSLATKGQTLGFRNYSQCYDACTMLAESYVRIGAVASMLGSTRLNWENELVQRTVEKMASIKAESIRENLEKQNTKFLEFVARCYKDHLG